MKILETRLDAQGTNIQVGDLVTYLVGKNYSWFPVTSGTYGAIIHLGYAEYGNVDVLFRGLRSRRSVSPGNLVKVNEDELPPCGRLGAIELRKLAGVLKYAEMYGGIYKMIDYDDIYFYICLKYNDRNNKIYRIPRLMVRFVLNNTLIFTQGREVNNYVAK